jgi:hypothetical protein
VKVKKWKMIVQANGIKKPTGLAILISQKADFNTKLEETKVITYYGIEDPEINPSIYSQLIFAKGANMLEKR